uniref:Uncharacterized protein n=1 Tax=Arundo donax TaxID=35708 RepID=A0A0A9EJY6_ARUDO
MPSRHTELGSASSFSPANGSRSAGEIRCRSNRRFSIDLAGAGDGSVVGVVLISTQRRGLRRPYHRGTRSCASQGAGDMAVAATLR